MEYLKENLKVFISNEEECKKAKELFSELGYRFSMLDYCESRKSLQVFYDGSGSTFSDHDTCSHKEISLQQLRDMVVLNRNDISDATHINYRVGGEYLVQGDNQYYMHEGKWFLSDCPNDLRPIEKSMNEYITKMQDGSYKLVPSYMGDGYIEIPEGADLYVYFEEYGDFYFYKGDFDAIWQDDGYWDYNMDECKSYCRKEGKVLWSRNYNTELEKQTDIRFATGHNLDVFGVYHSFRQRLEGESDQNYRKELLSFVKDYWSSIYESSVNIDREVKMNREKFESRNDVKRMFLYYQKLKFRDGLYYSNQVQCDHLNILFKMFCQYESKIEKVIHNIENKWCPYIELQDIEDEIKEILK